MFDNISPDKAKELGSFFSNAAIWVLVLGAILILTYLGFRFLRKKRQEKASKMPQYNRTAFTGGCFGIVYGATEEEPAYVAVFDSNGVEISRTSQDECDTFLGLADEENRLILYTMGDDNMYHKFYFDKEQLSFVEV